MEWHFKKINLQINKGVYNVFKKNQYLYMRQYMVIMTNPGIQKLTELLMIAYVLFALNIQSSVCSAW